MALLILSLMERIARIENVFYETQTVCYREYHSY